MRQEGKGRTGKPRDDDFEDDRTGDPGDEDATERAATAAAAPAGKNETLEAKAEKFILAMEEQQGEVDAINEQAKADGRPYRDEIKAIKKAAAEEGIPKKVISALFNRRRKLQQAARIADKLSADMADNYRDLVKGLGEDFMTNTPLGIYVAEKAKPASRRK